MWNIICYVFYVNILCGSLISNFWIVNSIIPKIYLKEIYLYIYICILYSVPVVSDNKEYWDLNIPDSRV